MSEDVAMSPTATVVSADGTTIAWEKTGSGPALVLIDGAMVSRAFGPARDLAAALASTFTVYFYDRRGRGDSGHGGPASGAHSSGTLTSVDREIGDLAGVLAATGEVPFVFGQSSGAALALEAASRGVPMRKLAVYEAPYTGGADAAGYQAELERRVAAGDNAGAVKFFLVDMVGAPFFVPLMMRLMPKVWKQLSATAATLPNDAAVLGDFTVPVERLSHIAVPTLVMGGSKAKPNMKAAVAGVADAIPGSTRKELAGQTHQLSPAAVVPELTTFFE